LWEFPAEFSEDESELLALNKLRGVGKKGWLGMRELSTDRYPKLFPSIKKYFPEGLRDADGKPIADFLEGFRAVTLDGNPVFSRWLMVPGHEHYCHMPCGNKPAYLEYLRREIEMMIDAGAPGVHLDEFETQLLAMYTGGCFCPDCMREFRAYLLAHPSAETQALDLASFDYREFLKRQGYADADLIPRDPDERFRIPLFRAFLHFNLEGIEKNVAEIADYVRAYSRRKNGKPALVTVNLYNCVPHSAAARQHCDLIVGEKGDVKLRQDGFYRFGHAFFGGKPGCFIEDPGPHVLQIISDLDAARNDSYILFRLEPLAHGFNMAIPYGAWLMNKRQDSFYPNPDVERQLGAWLKSRDHLFTNQFVAETAVLYDQRSALDTELFQGGHRNAWRDSGFHAFHDLCQTLCTERLLYNVLYVSPDQPLTAERLADYRNLILPDVCGLPDHEVDAIKAWSARGGRARALGKVAPRLAAIPCCGEDCRELKAWLAEAGTVLEAEEVEGLGLSLHKREGGYALHLVNYRLSPISRVIEAIPSAQFRLGWRPKSVQVHTFPQAATHAALEGNVLTVRDLGIYTVVALG